MGILYSTIFNYETLWEHYIAPSLTIRHYWNIIYHCPFSVRPMHIS